MASMDDQIRGLFDEAFGASALPDAIRGRAREVAQLAPGDLPAGTSVGPYEVVRTLGRGGMATVYLARRRGGVGTEVALKVPRPEVAERLVREAKILEKLRHERIVRIFEASFDGPIPYLAMEYLRG